MRALPDWSRGKATTRLLLAIAHLCLVGLSVLRGLKYVDEHQKQFAFRFLLKMQDATALASCCESVSNRLYLSGNCNGVMLLV